MAAISNADITQASSLTTSTDGKYTVTGSGIFDDLMEAANTHLSAQFNLGRITGKDYATVYLGAIQSSLQGSVQFILGKQQADKQSDLLTKQILTEEKKTLDVVSTTSVRDVQSAKDLLVKQEQVDMSVAQQATEAKKALDVVSTTAVRDTQSTKDALLKTAQTDFTTNQAASELKKALDIVNQTTNRSAAQTTSESNAVQQRLLIINQSATELKKALDLVSTTTVRNTQSTKDGNLKDAQKDKVTNEKTLLAQKEITEYSQTQQTTKVAPNANSILGKQAELYEEQAKGFKWNADQKYLDTLLRAWGMNVNTAGVPSTAVTAFGATGTLNINTVISDGKPADP